MLTAMLHPDPAERLSLHAVRAHPWVLGRDLDTIWANAAHPKSSTSPLAAHLSASPRPCREVGWGRRWFGQCAGLVCGARRQRRLHQLAPLRSSSCRPGAITDVPAPSTPSSAAASRWPGQTNGHDSNDENNDNNDGGARDSVAADAFRTSFANRLSAQQASAMAVATQQYTTLHRRNQARERRRVRQQSTHASQRVYARAQRHHVRLEA